MKSKEEPSLDSRRGNPSAHRDPRRDHRFIVPTGTYRSGGERETSLESVPRVSDGSGGRSRPTWSEPGSRSGRTAAPLAPTASRWPSSPIGSARRWPAIRQQLLDGTYRPEPVRRKAIAKPDGGERLLGIPNVLDRLIQQAILQVLTPVFDPTFSESSYGFRPGRSAHGAAKQVQRTIRRGYRFVVDMDLSKFFDRVQHDVLMARVSRKVRDPRLLTLIGRYLRAGVMVEGVLQASEEGTPQGGPASPFLANILLDDLDKELERRGSAVRALRR